MYNPQFNITNDILEYVSKIEAAKEVIDNAPIVPNWERRFQEEALLRQVHHSTAIEDNSLNYTEVKKVLAGEEVVATRSRDIKEIINYRKAVKLLDFAPEILSSELMFDINRTLLKDILEDTKIGSLRKVDVMIVNNKSNEIVMEPPKRDEIPILIDDLVEWYNKDHRIHPILRSGIVQYEITAIHPFVEGNGRTARLLSTWSLYTSGYKVNKFFSLEEYYDRDSKGYYDALASADESGDLSNWLEYYTKGLALEFERIKSKVLELSQDKILRNRLGNQIAINDRQIKIINHIQSEGQMNNKDFPVLFPRISDDTVLRELKDLLDKKIVKKVGKTRGARYILR